MPAFCKFCHYLGNRLLGIALKCLDVNFTPREHINLNRCLLLNSIESIYGDIHDSFGYILQLKGSNDF